MDHGGRLHDHVGGPHSGRGVGARMGRWCATTRVPGAPAQQYAGVPLEGWGLHTRPWPTMIPGAGPDQPWDAAAEGSLRAALGPHVG